MIRYDKASTVGEAGNVYEVNVKLPKMNAPELTDAWLENEVGLAVEAFAEKLRARYRWIGEVYLTGRSNGWLAIQDRTGGARLATLQTIDGLVTLAHLQFVKRMEKTYRALTPAEDTVRRALAAPDDLFRLQPLH